MIIYRKSLKWKKRSKLIVGGLTVACIFGLSVLGLILTYSNTIKAGCYPHDALIGLTYYDFLSYFYLGTFGCGSTLALAAVGYKLNYKIIEEKEEYPDE